MAFKRISLASVLVLFGMLALSTNGRAGGAFVTLKSEIPIDANGVNAVWPIGDSDFKITYEDESREIVFSPDGKEKSPNDVSSDSGNGEASCPAHIVKAGSDGNVTISDASGNQKTYEILQIVPPDPEFGFSPDRLSLSCNGEYLFYYDDYGDGLIVVDLLKGKVLKDPSWSEVQNYSIIGPKGEYALIVPHDFEGYMLWRFPDTLIGDIPVMHQIDAPGFSQDGRFVRVQRNAGEGTQPTDVYSTKNGKLLGRVYGVTSEFSNNGKYLATLDKEQSVMRFYDLKE